MRRPSSLLNSAIVCAAFIALQGLVSAQTVADKPIPIRNVSWFQLDSDGRQKQRMIMVELYADRLTLFAFQVDKNKPLATERPTIAYADITALEYGTGAEGSLNIGLGFSTSGSSHWLTVKTVTNYYMLRVTDTSRFKLFAAELEKRSQRRITLAGATP